ncbi:MAG: aldo/keto reductase [Vicinamibacterales bacterium]
MEYVSLGRTGLKVSRLCLGMMSYGTPKWRSWVLPEEESRPIVRRAIDLGINFFDTADMYSDGASEEVTGRVLRDMTSRDQVVVATKVYFPLTAGPNTSGLSRYHIMNAIDGSLRRLGMDHVDLYQIHRLDPKTPFDETLRALEDIVRAGKARYIGASSMFAWQFATMLHTSDRHGWSRFVSMQNHYNLVYREEEREMLPFCEAEGIATIPWSPLARGFLAGNRSREGYGATERAKTDTFAHDLYYADQDFQIAERAASLAEARGVAPAQVALAWLLRQKGVTSPIIGATKLSHLEQSVAALDLVLSNEECRQLEELYRPKPISGHS